MYWDRVLATIILGTATLAAQHHHEPPRDAVTQPVPLWENIGRLNHRVTTANSEAQKYFNQGLTFVYGFNHAEAVRSFQRAAEMDPKLAMAQWGVALALGMNINVGMNPEDKPVVLAALKKARELAPTASQREQDYVAALAHRYSEDPKAKQPALEQKYAGAMRALAAKYPDDLDAATLFAESLMNLNPWRLWTNDGKPNTHTEEILQVLERVLDREPEHMGANHYYIHAVEASPWPARALPAARRLAAQAPAAGHLVHMPAHIYMRMGDYEAAAQANLAAVEADRDYLKRSGVKGVYQAYYAHNLDFLSAAYSMQGRYADAYKSSVECRAVLGPMVDMLPFFESVLAYPLMVQTRFHRWDELLEQATPEAKYKTATNLWRFTRGMALAGKGRLPEAEKLRDELARELEAIPADRNYGQNPERSIMRIAMADLEAKIAAAKGDLPAAVKHLREGVAVEDGLHYNEPPDWYYPPTREALGAALLQSGRAAEAEEVFRADLIKNRRNGRSLFGLWEALKAQGKKDEAALVEPLFQTAWSRAEQPLTARDLF